MEEGDAKAKEFQSQEPSGLAKSSPQAHQELPKAEGGAKVADKVRLSLRVSRKQS